MKQTIKIQYLKDKVNHSLKSINLTSDQKEALATLLEGVLLDNKCYNGFVFLDDHKEPIPSYMDYKRKYL